MEISGSSLLIDASVDASSNSTLSPQQIDASYGATMTGDAAAFQDSLALAAANGAGDASADAIAKAVFAPLSHIDQEASSLAEYAETALESQNTLTPSEMVALTVRSQEFMFHSQLTANIANRTADGVQQLFRQQS